MTFNIPNILFICLILLTPWASFIVKNFAILNQVIYLIITFSIGVYLFYTGIYKKYLFIKIFLTLTLLIFIVNLLSMDSFVEMIKFPLIILLTVFSLLLSRYLTLTKFLTEKKIILFASYIILILGLFIFIDKSNGISYYDTGTGIVSAGIAGNISKYAAILFPTFAIFIYHQKYFVAFIQIVLILLTQRRSGLLAELIFISILILPNIKNFFMLKFNFKKIILFLFVFSSFFIYFNDIIFNAISSFLVRFDDITEGSAGGRKIFWALAFDFYLSFDTLSLVFGKPGALPVFLDAKFGLAIGAHSDIIDFLCNYGAIGLTLYLLIYISIFQFFLKNYTLARKESIIGMAYVVSMSFLSISTGGFFYSLNIMFFVFTGYLVAIIEMKKENQYE